MTLKEIRQMERLLEMDFVAAFPGSKRKYDVGLAPDTFPDANRELTQAYEMGKRHGEKIANAKHEGERRNEV